MFNASFDSNEFMKDISNAVEYSVGFLEGAQRGKNVFLKNFGSNISTILDNYIDVNARVDQASLQHVYEWEKSGSPDSRLFDINYFVTGNGLSFNATFRQSISIKNGSNTPFYDKARIMEEGIPVVIKPKKSAVLAFQEGEDAVFTRKPVSISDPGGAAAKGGFERTFKSFFGNYFTQAFLQSSGLARHLENPSSFSKNFSAARRGGRSLGITTGFRWITSAGIEAV
jgi:hypothetical protein